MEHNILEEFKKLSPREQVELIRELESNIGNEAKILSCRAIPEKPNCFHCHSSSVIKFGTYSNGSKARYRCKTCKKTFSDFTGTSVYNVKKKHLWISFVKLMLDNKTIREISVQLHLSTTTVFNWRHRVLSSFENTLTQSFKGIVETDDVFLRFNQKGRRKNFRKIATGKKGIVAVIVTADRYRTLDMRVAKLGRISVSDLERVVNVDRLNPDNVVCSDMHPAIGRFFKSLNMKHVRFKSSAKHYVKDKVYHVNKVNSLTSELKRWLYGSFKNVSTKYLQNYLNWFEMVQALQGKEELENFLTYSLQDDKTYARRKEIGKTYEKLLTY